MDKSAIKLGSAPTESGMYIIYEKSGSFPFPEKRLMMFFDGAWQHPSSDQKFRGEILGYIGPLPSPRVSELVGSDMGIPISEALK